MEEKKKGFKKINYKGIKFKIIFSLSLSGLLLLCMIVVLLSSALTKIEEKLMTDKFTSDLAYVEDEISVGQENPQWRLDIFYGSDDKAQYKLYYGDTYIGDGENRNTELVKKIAHYEEITNTQFYFFIKVDDEDVKDNNGSTYDHDRNYERGHFRRACGTTVDADGFTLLGTFIDKDISDDLETDLANGGEGIYSGSSNVMGEKMFCQYKLLLDESGTVVGIISCGKKNADMVSYIQQQRGRSILLYVFFMSLGVGGVAYLCTMIVGNLGIITKRLKVIGEGDLTQEPLFIDSEDEIHDIAESINEMTISLQEKERIGSELNVASRIQVGLLPRIFPAFPSRHEFDIYASMTPAKEVGGDFYDFFFIDENHLALVMADVSGKGVPAALIMAITKALIKNQSQLNSEPQDILRNVNNTICEGNEMNLFITTWLGIFDIQTGILKYTNAGHNPPLIKLKGNRFEYLTPRHGFVLGGMSGVKYKQDQLKLEPGDRLFLYTDGVTESTSVDKKLYGEERLKAYMNEHDEDFGPKDMITNIFTQLTDFMEGAEQFDDITMLMIDYYGPKKENGGVDIEVDATLENLDKVNELIETQCEAIGVDMKTVHSLLICAEEIYVNIANYAYKDHNGKAIITFSHHDGQIDLIFKDNGIKFDPLAKPDPDITLSAEDRGIGGLGILMVKKMMDDVKYEHKQGFNILTIIKKVGV